MLKKKNLSFIMTLTICLTYMSTFVYATAGDQTSGPAPDVSAITSVLTPILSGLLALAGAICVAKIAHIGILFMTSSAVDKSNAKASLLPWIVGTIVCFGASWIGPWIISLFSVPGNVLDVK